ncbi:FtsK/SpoIIIE domain-containing protein [Mycobacterium mantenii]|uniref:FtsK domain-containing protein n=1 Tax=Mycobacterium mantenii TaxID=560555 RepID=A0A1A2T9P8_MYCNT|nr:FtsK/SpoIIIE domain-containing protein [Mycobacterium mantenii]OBH47311.1 hypothetical protein A5688_03135 [Mycobacterium mantenii]OBH73128.1 hypothetical protein A5683_25245 [Mycobacterium mantenii]
MSTTRTESAPGIVDAAKLVAAAMLDVAAATPRVQRVYLPSLFGLEPADVFLALEAEFDPTPAVEIGIPGGHIGLLGIPTAGATLIPYLVTRTDGTEGSSHKPNCGSAGFAARVRDEVQYAASERPVLLLVLDPEPVDTVLTAAKDARELPELEWSALVERAVSNLPAAPPISQSVVADFVKRDVPQDAEQLAALLRLFRESGTDTQLGARLYELGCYLSDPQLATDDPQRLRRGVNWRAKLERWSAPGQDLALQLTAAYGDAEAPGRKKILNAATAFGIDYSAFTLNDLPEALPKDRLTIARPVNVRGAVAVAGGDSVALWLPGGGTFAILLKGTPSPADHATITWRGAQPDEAVIDAGRRELRIPCEASGEWVFGVLALGQGVPLRLAVFTGEGSWFPAEASFDVDPQTGCFLYEGEPEVVAVDSSGTIVFAPGIEPAGTGVVVAGEPIQYAAVWGSESHPIYLLDTGQVGAETPGEPGEPGAQGVDEPGDSGDGDDQSNFPDGGGDSQTPLPGTAIPDPLPSVPHAKLEVARRQLDADLSAVKFGVADGRGFISNMGGPSPKLSPQRLSIGGVTVNGLDLERQILALPQATAYTAGFEEGQLQLEPDSLLERLALDDLGEAELEAFWSARRDMFQALQPHGSAHAIAAGVARDEASRYVKAYAQLLERAALGGPFRAEYERLILCDVITDVASGELLLAPTNPVTIAFLQRFDDQVTSWLPKAVEVLDADLKSCSIRHLLPTFALRENWYESVGGVPMLWRRYRKLPSAALGTDHDSGYITRRLHHFLEVFPEYRDDRQVLAVSFIEPGDGGAVLTALRRFYEPLARVAGPGRTASPLPSIDLTVVASNRPEKLERAMFAIDELVDAVLRDRVSLTVAEPGEQRPDFAHLTFIFRSPLRRQPATLNFSARASTLFVGGLASAPGRQTTPGRNETQFSWGTFPGRSPKQGDSLEGLVHACLEVVGGMPREQIVPNSTRMPSTRVSTGFLTEIYTRSVWVVHLDRLLGLEAFAASGAGENQRYLIDYEDRAEAGQPGLDAITATERVDPYHLALRKVLREIGNPRRSALDRILSHLNSVNGKWALDLLGADPSRIRERVGIVAGIAAVADLDGAFTPKEESVTVMLALDEVLDALPTDGRTRPLGRHCDDLLVLTMPLTGGTTPVADGPVRISGRLLEVKYRSVSDPELPALARPQLEAAREWLASKFNSDGPSRLFRARDLAELIRGGIARGEAFGLIPEVASGPVIDAVEARLEQVSQGEFHLDLSFDVEARRFHGEFISVEADSGFAAHRQVLPGTGQPLSWLRLGRPVLEALAAGAPVPGPATFKPATVPSIVPPEGPAPSGHGGPAGAPDTPVDSGGATPAAGDSSPSPDAPLPDQPEVRVPAGRRDPARDAETQRVASELTEAAAKYGLNVEPFDPALAEVGPSIIRLRTRLLGRQTLSGLQSRADDLGREVGVAEGLLIDQEPYYVTVDVPRAERETVRYSDYAHLLDGPAEPGALNFLLGVAPSGEVRIADLARLPHLLVAGATGSGKSVLLRALVSSLVRARNPQGLQLLVCDPQTVNYEPFEGGMHLVEGRIITDPLEMVGQLNDTLARELDRRRATLRAARVTSALEFYEEGGVPEELRQMVIIIDEFADLTDALQRDARAAFMQNVKRFAQMTRALGIYLVLATQRPSVQIITGDIKANLTARVALRVQASQDSITIIGRGGAESLRDKGDLLFDHGGRLEHLQGFLCTPLDAVAEVGRWQAG